jgi:hypothetical protein
MCNVTIVNYQLAPGSLLQIAWISFWSDIGINSDNKSFFKQSFRLLAGDFLLHAQEKVTKEKGAPVDLSLRDSLVTSLFLAACAYTTSLSWSR